jgi:carbamoyl-phosphate synthase large subunit
MNVLISSGGRRVGLAKCFRESLAALRLNGRIVGIDASSCAPIAHFVDAFYEVPRCTDASFLPAVEQICERERVDVIVPAIDTELPVYAAAKESFRRRGIVIAVSTPETIEISSNKVLTHSWLSARGFPVPKQSTPECVLAEPSEWRLPLIVKLKNGSASVGVRVVQSLEELAAAASSDSDNWIVQELIAGSEYTVNVFVNGHGQCICAVPHARLEVRAGEVSKARTVRNEALMQTVIRIVEALPGAYGALNVQCFLTPAGEIRIIEINARFGGGYPLAHKAGAEITRWLLQDVLGSGPATFYNTWEDGLLMLRYDEAVFSSRELKIWKPAQAPD